jgi:uncharacterized protein RhaS with RHS repeats
VKSKRTARDLTPILPQRWYDPELGRFLSEDPAGLAGGINPYVFADNDPVNNNDPSGMLVDYDPVCVHFSNGKWMCSYSPVNITASATSPFSNPNSWIDSREPADVPAHSAGFSEADVKTIISGVARKTQPFQHFVNCVGSVATAGAIGWLDASGAGEIYDGIMGTKMAVATISAVSIETARGSVTLASVRASTMRVAADATAVRNIDVGMLQGAAFGGSISVVAQHPAPFWSYLPIGGTVDATHTAYTTCR